ncbi:MAG: AAA family ATPase [Scytonema hyalinum WJT4-NPBG1]|jgi:WD40 repeat protein/energy-coupling factor transporter ATP-binding protein EcfA2|nr:AAA family ATPase [Scytonema hyalinum WJT4-NPBG1]
MRKLLVLKLDGDIIEGVRATLNVEEHGNHPHIEITGYLPANQELAAALKRWQSNYRSWGRSYRIKAIVTERQWRQDCYSSAKELHQQLNRWLLSDSFRPIREQCLQQFVSPHEVQVLIRTSSQLLLKLPWYLWDLVDKNSLLEVVFGKPDCEPRIRAKTPTLRGKVKILAILGNSIGIDVQKDRQALEDLPDAETTFLVEPQRSDISDSLWKQDWDILFFAGHSQTEGDKGRIYINQTESLTLDELRYALRNAVNRGLTLAVFNSCDGMGLAFELQQLHIPQIIVMREPVPDVVAQKFITDFLPLLASGKYLYLAQREAREKLQGLEYQFPCASWLPVMFQDPATVQPTWQDLGRRSTNLCPYRGLFAFSEEDAQFFFGRDAFISRLLSAVQNESLVAVIGPSGSGKSSVVFAGLIPELRRAGNWLVASFRPSSRPFYALASTLVNHLEPQISGDAKLQKIEDLVAQLQSANSLQNVAGDITTRNPKCKLLLVADQFEELYTLSQDLQERQIFLDRLLEAIACPSDLTVVITLRADFLAQALSYRPFADALQHRDLKLGPMNASELLAAIEQPAALLGVTLEPGLAERILGAIATQAGNLPLLEFALTQLWEKRIDTVLQNAAYNEIHGVEAAVAHYADRVYDKLNQKEKEQARLIFIQLVHLGEQTGDTRRLATRVEVGEENWDLVTRLADDRLVVTGYDEATGNETVEIVHEALIQKWGHLRQWLELDRDFRTWLQELRAARQQWEKSNRDKDALLRGKALADAQQWLQKRPDELTLEQEYIKASLTLQQNEQHRRERTKRLILAGSTSGALILAGVLGFGWWQTEIQRQQAQRNEINALTVSSEKSLIANQSFDALIDGLKAGKKLTQAVWADPKLNQQVVKVLQQAVDTVKELNRLEGQKGHTDWVYGVSFSPDGNTIVSASLDKTVKLWNKYGLLLKTLDHKEKVYGISFCPKGRMFATASEDKTVKVWNEYGILHKTLNHNDTVLKVSFAPDCKTLVTASGKQVLLWNVDEQKLKRILKKNSSPVNSVSFNPDGKIIATASDDDHSISLLNLDGKEIQNLKGHHKDKVYDISFSPDGKTIATASWDKTAKLWNQVDGTWRAKTLTGHTDRLFGISFSPDGNTIATASWDRTVRLWNRDGTLRITIKHGDRVNNVSFSPQGNMMASGGADNTVKLWRIDSSLLPIQVQAHSKAVRSVSFNPKLDMIATASEDETASKCGTDSYGTAKLWNLNGRLLKILKCSGAVNGVSFSPDGKIIATANADKTTQLWNTEGKEVATLKGHSGEVFFASFSPDGKMIVTASADKTAKLWDLNLNGKYMKTLGGDQGHRERVVDVSFSPDGKTIATASDDRTAKIWKLDGTLCVTLEGHEDEVNGISFSPDGRTIATASDDKTVKLWKLDDTLCQTPNRTINAYKTLIGHEERIISVKFSPNGKQIASASFDKTIKLWKQDGRLLRTFQGHDDWVWSVDFSSDGKNLLRLATIQLLDFGTLAT